MNSPRVTVLMAVYNGERFLRPAIQSVLNQTFTDFELLIVNDASTDKTLQIIHSFNDPRIRVINNPSNCGVAYSRNIGLQNAGGLYVAILDADDIAYPNRLMEQLDFMSKHPEVALVGGAQDLIDELGNNIGRMYFPKDPVVIRWKLLFRNCIAHSTVMYKTQAALDEGGYNEALVVAEDYSLWGRLADRYLLVQTDHVLTQYRSTSTGLAITTQHSGKLDQDSIIVARDNIKRLIGVSISIDVARCLFGGSINPCKEVLDQSYIVQLKCFLIMVTKYCLTRNDRRRLFIASLADFLRVARQSDTHRLKALRVVLHIGLRYVPECLFSSQFLEFVLRTILPRWIRQGLTLKTI